MTRSIFGDWPYQQPYSTLLQVELSDTYEVQKRLRRTLLLVGKPSLCFVFENSLSSKERLGFYLESALEYSATKFPPFLCTTFTPFFRITIPVLEPFLPDKVPQERMFEPTYIRIEKMPCGQYCHSRTFLVLVFSLPIFHQGQCSYLRCHKNVQLISSNSHNLFALYRHFLLPI